MYCINCGKQLEEEMRFCQFCGNEIAAEQNNVAGQNNLVGNIKTKFQNGGAQRNKIIISVCAVAAVIMLFMVFRSTPEKTVKNFFESFSKGDFKNAMEYIDTSKYSASERADMQEEILELEGLKKDKEFILGMQNISVQNMQVLSKSDDYCVMNVTIGALGEFESNKLILAKVNGKWKIDMKNSDGVMF